MTSRKLNKALLNADPSKAGNTLLCIDFGTALSKAAATNGSGYRPLLLPLGELGKDPRAANKYVAQSSLFVDSQKTLRFGHEAVAHWARQRTYAIARIDSMKRWLSVGQMGDLDREPVDAQYLPEGCSLSKGEALILILAYVTDLACAGLAAARLPRHVVRRFTRPVWTGDRERWCDEHMARYLRYAQLVADSLSGLWNEGIPLEEARDLVRQAQAEHVPEWIVEPRGVPEPIAAGHSRVERDYEQRYMALVVDVGAGTTDLAVFAGTQGDGSVGLTIAMPQGNGRSIFEAGDRLDELLREEILGGLPASARSDLVLRQAEGYAREWKETLFTDDIVRPTFAGGIVAPATTKDQFLLLAGAREFSRAIKAAVDEVFDSVSGLAGRMAETLQHPLREITVLASGGGAGLPMIRNLARGRIRLGGRQFPMRDAGPAPEWFATNHREEVPVFHQMAVAIGGAFPKLPGPPDLSKRPPRNSL